MKKQENDNKKGNTLGYTVETAVTVIGGALGALGGPIGGAAGAAFSKVGVDIVKRTLSSREEKRVGDAFEYCKEKIIQNNTSGMELRNDGFFDPKVDEWSQASEILEGVLLKVKNEHEEKKNKYIAYIMANLCYRDFAYVSAMQANYFLKIADQLTYNQYCVLTLIGKNMDNKFDLRNISSEGITGSEFVTTLHSIRELESLGLVLQYENSQSSQPHAVLGIEDIIPAYTVLSDIGQIFFELTGLNEMPESEYKHIKDLLK